MRKNFTRSFLPLKVLLLFVLVFSAWSTSKAQTNNITFTLIKQPCNNDGILAAHITGATPPITVNWYAGGKTITHVTQTNDDTLFNYSGGMLYVSTSPSPGFYGSYAGSPPFTFKIDSVVSAVCPALGQVDVTVTGGTAPFTFEWLDLTGTIVATGNPGMLPAGSFNVKITDAAGCVFGSYGTSSGTFQGTVYVNNVSPITFTIDTTVAKCTNGTATIKNLAGGISPYGFKWSNGANTQSISNLIQGSYQVTVTDAQGCYKVGYVYITQKPAITVNTTITNATCLQNDGSIIAFGSGGLPPYAYIWNNAQQTQSVSGLTAGYYTVTVTDANHCIGSKFSYVTSSTPITATYSATASSCTSGTGTATLNISGGTSPYTVVWYTYPSQNGITATGLLSGSYSFHITDAVGCVRTGSAYVPPVSIVTANVFTADAMCTQSNGSASVIIVTGTAPYDYAWSTGETTASVKNLHAGGYSVMITDKKGCSITKFAIIKTATPVKLGFNVTPASCIFNTDGSVVSIASGGTAPYTYHWSNGQTTATATGLVQGKYYLNVQDAAGCVQSGWTTVTYDPSNNSCYCTLSGTVYEDQNNDCVHDSGEPGIENIMIHCSGIGYTFTNSAGVYAFQVPSGTYTVTETVKAFYPLASCESNTATVTVTASSGCVRTTDFANVVNPIHDVKISTTNFNPPVPGHSYLQKVVIENYGTVTEPSVQAGYVHDGQLVLNNFVPSLFIQQNPGGFPNWYSITSGLSLAPGAEQDFNITYTVPTNIPIGTQVDFKDTTAYASPIANWLSDYSPWDNVNQYQNTVLGSFDPNYIEVTPKGMDIPGFITNDDSILTYTIHFQNTGTYMAEKIVLVDTLSNNVDPRTFQPGYSTHDNTVNMTDNGIVTFTFNNINLPDSASQPLASIGIVMYTVHLKPNLAGNTEIKNAASIYFDYNAPVKTNTVLNTISRVTGDMKLKENGLDFIAYPNPANGNVSLLINADESGDATLKVYNLLGSEMKSQVLKLEKGQSKYVTRLNTLPAGLYFIELSRGNKSLIQKLTLTRE